MSVYVKFFRVILPVFRGLSDTGALVFDLPVFRGLSDTGARGLSGYFTRALGL